ncbi:hypothetical protein [Ligilactobacillus equi]|uniref:Uncharacterized protein n=2 Tax=Ligilactobacillus equi TaxID=137357 RepID=V7HZ63_9LACO|nr:hypothetical protein [Ligilactobacillus equi]ETA74488.1 hypothetical protein LEQ_0353 [Ligilactobacillus equi DPC 6820]KRL78112.1 hypothetical protein FC36_GL001162 [Ligilactobacillus equi DSM 15833 = JCM 10991]
MDDMTDIYRSYEFMRANMPKPITKEQLKEKLSPTTHLEFVIREDGLIQPLRGSHENVMVFLICNRDNITYADYMENMPKEYWFDTWDYAFLHYGGIFVWPDRQISGKKTTPEAQNTCNWLLDNHIIYKWKRGEING